MKSSRILFNLFVMLVFAAFAFSGLASPAWNSLFRVQAASGLTGYFVSPTGNDANPGTEAAPWRTIGKAVNMSAPGMTIYLRGGIYTEALVVTHSGTQSQPIRFLAYPGETPILDGGNHLPAYWQGLFSINSDWVQLSGLEIRNSAYDGVGLYGNHDSADTLSIHHNFYRGLLLKGDYGTVQNCRVWRNSLNNENGASPSQWSSGISSADPSGSAEYGVIRNNVVWENWGEGISAYNSNGTLVESNIVHDSYSTNFYVSDATNITVKGNFAYMDPSSYVFGHGSNVGFMLGDEQYNPPSANITLINNLAYGNNRNLYWWQGVQGGGMNNVLFANNTFVNSVGTGDVVFMQGPHQNVRFANNIVEQDNSLPVISAASGISYSYNLWSKTPSATAAGAGDFVGNPLLAKTGSYFDPAWYQLAAGSPAIDKALVFSEVTTDYYGNPRGSAPDKGAIEKTSAVVQPTAAATAAATATLAAPTATRIPPTATVAAPTATRVPPTATAAAPTATRVPPTATAAAPTATRVPPTATVAAPTAIPVGPTATVAAPASPTYYVSPSGNDSNPGTINSPWRTINKAAQTVGAGSVVYVRGGTYSEQVNIIKSGSQSAPIKFMAYSGETPVIDGTNLTNGSGSALLYLSGNYITASGFEVRNSKAIGILLLGQHDTVDSVYSHDNRENGIYINGDYGTARSSKVYRNSLINENGVSKSWYSGIFAGRDTVDGLTSNAVITYNTVWENWGDGISTSQASGTLIEKNVTHDNSSGNILISDATNVSAKRNFIYMNTSSPVYGHGANVGIEMGDLKYNPASANIKITDNIVYGARRNFYWWAGPQGGAMNNVLIADNTFVNSTYSANVVIAQANHQSVSFINNIVEQDDTLPVIVASTNVKYTYNLWSKTASSNAAGTGNAVGNPMLAKSGSPYAADYYKLLDGSPAINKGLALSDVTVDYNGTTRANPPDKGALEK